MKIKNIVAVVFVFFSGTSCFSQVDKVNRELYKYMTTVDVESASIRDYLSEKIAEIVTTTKDTALQRVASTYLKTIDTLTFTSKRVDTAKLTKEMLKNFNVTTDKFKGSTFYTHKKSGTYSELAVYIGVKDNEAVLRLQTRYHGTYWVFTDRVILIIGDKRYSYDVKSLEKDVQSGGYVFEHSDQSVDKRLMKILSALAAYDKDVDIRFEGSDKVADKILSKKHLTAIRETLELFNAM